MSEFTFTSKPKTKKEQNRFVIVQFRGDEKVALTKADTYHVALNSLRRFQRIGIPDIEVVDKKVLKSVKAKKTKKA